MEPGRRDQSERNEEEAAGTGVRVAVMTPEGVRYCRDELSGKRCGFEIRANGTGRYVAREKGKIAGNAVICFGSL